MTEKRILVISGFIACLVACFGDFLALFIFGPRFQGYSQIYDTMSRLGSSESPVSGIISSWWIILGLLIIIFSIGFRVAFSPADIYTRISFWCLVFYGLGEGIGSGLFKADRISGSYTFSFLIHDILGGIGIGAIMVLPFVVPRIKPHFSGKNFHRFSQLTLSVGLLFFILFSFRLIGVGDNSFIGYKGLWQRLFILVYYVYFLAIAFKMIRKSD